MNTNDLIEELAKNLAPVEPLWRSGRRAAVWLIGAAVYVGVLVLAMSEPDGAANLIDASVALPQLAAIVTGVLAATAAFASVVPGRSMRVLVWPAIAALVWLGTLIIGARLDQPTAILAAEHEWLCVGLILFGGAPLLAWLAVMLRRGAPLNPAVTAALAAIAVGTLANVGACFWRPHTNEEITLVWHGGTILVLALVCIWGARFVLTWGAAGRSARVQRS
jgi:hypothetical protein